MEDRPRAGARTHAARRAVSAVSRHAALVVTAALAAACGAGPLGPAPGSPSTLTVTDNTAYDARPTADGFRVEIPFRLDNRLAVPLFVTGCHAGARLDLGMALDHWTGGGWQEVWQPVSPACVTLPAVVPAGAALVDTLHVVACTRGACASELLGPDPSGVYRLRWVGLFMTADNTPTGDPVRLPDALLPTNPFELRGR